MPPYFDVVVRRETLREAVVHGRKRGYAFVSLAAAVAVVVDFPYPDFVVLVGAEEFFAEN